jgi:hypothetical protein
MSHMTLEALARLVDEAPDDAERAHLETCAGCRAELRELLEQREALAALPDLAPGPDQWPALRAQLKREGLIRRRGLPMEAAGRTAAAILLFLAGGAAGYAVRGPASAPAAMPDPVVAAGEGTAGTAGTAAPSADDPGRDVEAAGEIFMAALDRYMASTGAPPADPATRLAALDNIVLTTAEALNEAPTDPIISGYHLSALAQRDAVLRQLTAGSRDPVF